MTWSRSANGPPRSCRRIERGGDRRVAKVHPGLAHELLEDEGVDVAAGVAAHDWSPIWSPDGGHLYFSSDRGGSTNIWRVAIDETTGETLGEPEPLTSGGVGEQGFLSISGDGTRILYNERITRAHVARASFDATTAREAGSIPASSGERHLVQVCADLSDPDTRRRELRALSEALDETELPAATLVSLHREGAVAVGTDRVRHVPAWRWVLE